MILPLSALWNQSVCLTRGNVSPASSTVPGTLKIYAWKPEPSFCFFLLQKRWLWLRGLLCRGTVGQPSYKDLKSRSLPNNTRTAPVTKGSAVTTAITGLLSRWGLVNTNGPTVCGWCAVGEAHLSWIRTKIRLWKKPIDTVRRLRVPWVPGLLVMGSQHLPWQHHTDMMLFAWTPWKDRIF